MSIFEDIGVTMKRVSPVREYFASEGTLIHEKSDGMFVRRRGPANIGKAPDRSCLRGRTDYNDSTNSVSP